MVLALTAMPCQSRPVTTSSGLIMAAMLVIAGGVITWVAWLGREQRLPLQHLAGIRTQATMKSPEAWRAAHVTAAPWLLATGAAALIGGLGVLVLTFVAPAAVLWVLTISGLAVVGLLTVAVIVGQGAARAEE